jgi:phosphate transport system protein
MALRTLFDRSLTQLQDDVLRLASLADAAILNSVKALTEYDGALAQQVDADDSKLNVLRYSIEENTHKLIALQQPNATDLRVIVGAVSIATNLERIGDHAAGIARLTLRMIDQPLLKPLVDIPRICDIAREMVSDAVQSYVQRNAVLAEAVIKRDDEVDALDDRVYRDLITIMTNDPTTVERATRLLWVSHNLERIADRACNISERAVYVATGELKEYD